MHSIIFIQIKMIKYFSKKSSIIFVVEPSYLFDFYTFAIIIKKVKLWEEHLNIEKLQK